MECLQRSMLEESNMKLLIIAPHADDEIIGVGGTMIKNITEGNEVFVCVMTRGVKPLFSDEYMDRLRSETIACHEYIGIKKTFYLEFPSVMLEGQHRYEINAKILEVVKETEPDEVYIPHIGDIQKDHQIVADCAMVALRPKYTFAPKKIYAYETLSETGWNIPNIQNEFIPNTFVDIFNSLEKKLEAMKKYASQVSDFPDARSLEAIEALAKYRGALMNVRAAEAFMLLREIR